MGKRVPRKLKHQFQYVITSSSKIGTSKRNDRLNGVDTKSGFYSISSIENMRAFANSFCNFMENHHQDIKYVKDITSEHFEEFIQSKISSWSGKTLKDRLYLIGKLEQITGQVFGVSVDYSKGLEKVPFIADKLERSQRVRDIAMSEQDVQLLKIDLKSGDDIAYNAVEIAHRSGLRAKEIAHLKYDCIDLDKNVIHVVEGSKGGKKRDVAIQPQDIEYYRGLTSNGSQGYIFAVNEDTLNDHIRKSLKILGLSEKYEKTTIHAIRKNYAQKLFNGLMDNGRTKEQAWSYVQQQLGHGSNHREELYRIYISTK